MIWVDYAILAVVLLSAFVSLIRGFVREALSLAGWVLAFWLALRFAPKLAGVIGDTIGDPTLRLAAAFLGLFIATLVVTGIINFFAAQLVQRTGLTGTDRMVGMVFGVLRGILLVAVVVLLAGLTNLPQSPWWGDSLFLHHFQVMAVWLRGFLPGDIAANFVY